MAVEDEVQLVLLKKRKSNGIIETRMDEESDDDISSTHEMDICSGCASLSSDGNDGLLLLCDSCPRAFCKRCVASVHSGDRASAWSAVEALAQSDDTWKCIYCKPTKELVRMQLSIKQPDLDSDSDTDDDEDDNIVRCEKETSRLLNELMTLENSYEEAARMLEESCIQDHRNEILKEMKESSDGHISQEELIENVELELSTWIEQWQDHHTRLAESIGIVQDLLSCPEHNIDLTAFYRLMKMELVDDPTHHKDTTVEDEPSWKRQADLTLSKNDADLGYVPGEFKGASGYKGKEENYLDFDELLDSQQNIEEINTLQDSLNIHEAIISRNSNSSRLHQWGSKSYTERDLSCFKKALDAENDELDNYHVDLRKRTMEKNDIIRDSTLIRNEYGATGRRSISSAPKRMILHEFKACVKKSSPIKRNGPARSYKADRSIEPQKKVAPRRVSLENMNQLNVSKTSSKSAEPFSKLAKSNADQKARVRKFVGSLVFPDSDVILGKIGDKSVSIAKPIADVLKPHQLAGVRFMYRNICSDFHTHNSEAKSINGCILAHCMGLGKSLQTIALLHCLLTHPALAKEPSNGSTLKRIVNRVLIVVPVNTLTNWRDEFRKWVSNIYK